MIIPYHHIDAFTSKIFSGNPAGVCMLDKWPEDLILQAIAAENCLSETAFLVNVGAYYELRWFSPRMEIDLCGHATLASAHAIFEHNGLDAKRVSFKTKSGVLTVERQSDLLVMDFPARPPQPCHPSANLSGVFGITPVETFEARDLMLVYENEDQIRNLKPDFAKLDAPNYFAVIVTAPGAGSDFVSRFFAPAAGVDEDPVTGSSHCTLIPYWSKRLGKTELYARQLSERGGELFCTDKGDRVAIGGRAVTYFSGMITTSPAQPSNEQVDRDVRQEKEW